MYPKSSKYTSEVKRKTKVLLYLREKRQKSTSLPKKTQKNFT